MGKKIGFYVFNVALLALCAGAANADTVTVNKTQPEVAGSNYNTINAALSYIKTTAEPREVQITDGGTYLEGFAINFNVTVKGIGNKPVLVTPKLAGSTPSTLAGNGLAFYTNSEFPGPQTFNLENLIVIPSITDIPTLGIKTNNNNPANSLSPDKLTLNLTGVVLTANKGDNTPLTTTGLTGESMTGATCFADDGMSIVGNSELNIQNTVISHNRGTGASPDGIVFNPDNPGYKLTVGPGSVISYNKRIGIQIARFGSITEIKGTKQNPVVFKGARQDGAGANGALSIFTRDNDLLTNGVDLENVVFIDNNGYGILGATLTAASYSLPYLTAKNCAFVNNKAAGVGATSALLANRTWSFENCTFVNNGLSTVAAEKAAIEVANGSVGSPAAVVKSVGNFTFKDSIIAGNGTAENGTGSNLIDIKAESAVFTFQNTAIVTAGPYALGASKFRLNGGTATAPTPAQTNVINSDPQFVAVGSNFASADFLDVANGAYVQASSTATPLKGYGDYVGPNASVTDWSTY